MDGFTRSRPNADRITCVSVNHTVEWRGELEDCVLNYCPLDELYDNIANAYGEVISFGKPPNVNSMEQLVRSLPSRQKAVGIFFEEAELLYHCIDGYSFGDSLQFTRTCKYYPQKIGFGRWEPANQSCNCMLENSQKESSIKTYKTQF